MSTKIKKITQVLALISFFFAYVAIFYATAAESLPLLEAANKIAVKTSAGFYQFNGLEISKISGVGELPATLEVIQKNEKSCVIYENGKNDRPLPCAFIGEQNNNYLIQIDERTTLLGSNQGPALLTDFATGDKINVLGWLTADGKTVRAAVLRSLENKSFHQSLSGVVKNVAADSFTLVLENGDEISVKTPITEGAQVTIKGVFDKVNKIVDSVLSVLVKPVAVVEEKPAPPVEPETPPQAPSAKPSVLFKNFLKVFGL